MVAVYLGDGVYATINVSDNEYPVVLTTGSHERDDADQIIYLEGSAMDLLMSLYKEQTSK